MNKILILLAISIVTFSASIFAQDVDFSIKTFSDNGDYIGGGKGWNFTPATKSIVTVQSATPGSVSFNAESFDISYMNFTFTSMDSELKQGLYSPAKRNPFRGSFNGIEVYGDGRGCNTILGHFYVHEYVLKSDGFLDRAAIDFVQYCEGGTKALYGSIRYNSSVASSCSDTKCSQVREYVLGEKGDKNTIDDNKPAEDFYSEMSSDLSPEQEQKMLVRLESLDKYESFWEYCDMEVLEDAEDDFAQGIMNLCPDHKTQMRKSKREVMRAMMKLRLSNEAYVANNKDKIIAAVDKQIALWDKKRTRLENTGRLSLDQDIQLSANIVIFQLLGIGLEIGY